MNTKIWTFTVHCQVQEEAEEVVCITGNVPSLGQWKTSDVVPLQLWDKEKNLWQTTLELPSNQSVKYRYCVCSFVESSSFGEVKTVLKKWETDLKPRLIKVAERHDPNVVHNFGFISDLSQPLIQTGWLCSESLVELKLYDRSLQLWKKKHKNNDLFIKVTPVDVNVAQSQQSISLDLDEISTDVADAREKKSSWPFVNVASFDDSEENYEYRPQSQFGVRYNENSFISFQAQVFDLKTVAFLVDVFGSSPDNPNQLPKTIGSCYLMPHFFKSTEGRVEVTILSKNFIPIGQFLPFYIIVNPLKKSISCDLSVSFARHWKSVWQGLDVGHRGLGDSYTSAQYCSNIRENTIASLKDAVSHGADVVEFDVQLTKDLVPVIYHDFDIVTSIVKKKEGQKMMHRMPLKNLTLEQLQDLKINHVEELTQGEKEFNDLDSDHQPCPTLERALNEIDPHIGFNIEIKWDMEMMDGSRECYHAFEVNLFVDAILETVLEKANSRKIFFSSFNPDICTILRCKQNKYPILLLTQGINDKWENYRDPRTWDIPNASKFVSMSEILGVNALAADLIRDPLQIKLVKGRGQVLFSWTDDKNDKDTVRYLKQLGVDGIVYDRMDVNNSKEIKESIFLAEKRLEQEELEQLDSVHEEGALSASSESTLVSPSSPSRGLSGPSYNTAASAPNLKVGMSIASPV